MKNWSLTINLYSFISKLIIIIFIILINNRNSNVFKNELDILSQNPVDNKDMIEKLKKYQNFDPINVCLNITKYIYYIFII